ncbi:MAG: carboxypeptidase regulatory-like domain-containing protein [Planctomycetota bacterium]
MKRLLPLLALVALAILVFWVLQDDGTPTETTEDPAQETQVEELAAATLDGTPERLVEAAPEPFDPRIVKTGNGNFGLTGTVVDEKGMPLADMWVGAYSAPYPFFDFEMEIAEIIDKPLELSLDPIASTRSDAEGKFQLEGLYGRGNYLVARGQHHLTRGRQEVRPSELDTEKGVLLHTVPGASLEGTVMDEFGAPVANAEVFVGPSLMYVIQAIRNRDIYLERTFTDGSGNFAIDVVPANQKLAVIALDGATHPGMRDFGPLLPNTDAKTKVQLVETGSLSGKIVDSDGNGVGGAKILAVPIDLRVIPGVVRALPEYIVESRSNGEYTFPQLPKRNVVLFAQGREGRAAPMASKVLGKDSVVPKDLVLQTMHDLTGRVIGMDGKPIAGAKVLLNSIPMPEGSSNRGRGMPSTDMMLMEAAKDILPELLPAETWANTDGTGRFHIAAWGGAKLRVEAEGYSKAVYTMPNKVEDKKLALILMQPGSVAGTVTREEDGQPLEFYVVNADQEASFFRPDEETEWGEDDDWQSFSARQKQERKDYEKEALAGIAQDDEIPLLPNKTAMNNLRNIQMRDDGKAEFQFDNLMPGLYEISARADGYVVSQQDGIRISPGEVTEGVDLKMSRGATLRGRVVAFGSREPVAGAVVTIGWAKESGFEAYFRMGVETTAMARSDKDGNFSLEGIEAGMEWVHVMAEGFSPTSIKGRELQEGEVREDVVIQVRQGSTIHGHVYDRHGAPIPARLVGGFAMDSQDFWQAATNEDGYYRVEHVKPGNYFIMTASLDDEALFTGNLMAVLNGSRIVQAYAKEGETLVVDIEDLSAGGCNLKGKILSNGTPVPDAVMFAMANDTGGIFDMRAATAQSNELGEFEFKSLAPGSYRVQIESKEWRGAIEMDVPEADEDYQILETPQGKVRGRVVSELTGNPVEDATVKLVRDDSAGGLFAMFSGGKETDWGNTDSNGEYEFEGKPAGRYHIEVEVNSWRSKDVVEDGAPLGKAQSKGFTLYENDLKVVEDLAMPISSAIKVRITDAKGEAPDDGYTLTAILQNPAEGQSSEPTSNWGWGEEGLISGVAPGTYTVRAEGRGFAKTQIENVVVGEAETVEIELKVEDGVQLSARILDANSQPIPGAAIKVLDSQGNRVDGLDGPTARFSRMFSSEDGTMPLGIYVPGSYVVEVEHDGRVLTRNAVLGSETVIVEFQF